MQHIVIVCGGICSGKNHYAMGRFSDYTLIESSSVVSELINSNNRKELQDTKHLDFDIADGIINKIKTGDENYIITGIRQTSIIYKICESLIDKKYNSNGEFIPCFHFTFVWLNVPYYIRKKRFYDRKDEMDGNNQFHGSNKRDDLLGLYKVKQLLCSNLFKYSHVIDYYDQSETKE